MSDSIYITYIIMEAEGCETNLREILVLIFNSLNHISIGSNTMYNNKRNYLRFYKFFLYCIGLFFYHCIGYT